MAEVAIIGEAMLELSHPSGDDARLGFGGDTLNTAVYLARLGVTPDFITALGTDPYSEKLIDQWQREGVRTTHVLCHPARLPGLYAIRTDPQGERSFYYWRSESAARAFFGLPGHETALAAAAEADWLYLTGITLSIFTPPERAVLAKTAAAVRAGGGEVVFDPNYRPRGWQSREAARAALADFAAHVSLVLPTLEDEIALHGEMPGEAHAERWLALGVQTVVKKSGPEGASIYRRGAEPVEIPVAGAVAPVDTTGAGDSFNAALIAGLIAGHPIEAAAAQANRLAGEVIRHSGAIIPRAAMPALEGA